MEQQRHGGAHVSSHPTTLCDLHPRAGYFEKLVIRGAAPDRLTFEFRKPRDRWNVTHNDAPLHAATTGDPHKQATCGHRRACSRALGELLGERVRRGYSVGRGLDGTSTLRPTGKPGAA